MFVTNFNVSAMFYFYNIRYRSYTKFDVKFDLLDPHSPKNRSKPFFSSWNCPKPGMFYLQNIRYWCYTKSDVKFEFLDPNLPENRSKPVFYFMELPKTGNVLFLEHLISVIQQI